MHRASATPAISLCQPENLGEGPSTDRADFVGDRLFRGDLLPGNITERFREELMVRPMGSIDLVGGPQSEHGADGAPFLSDRRMSWAMDQTLAGELEDLLLEGPNQHHAVEHGTQQCGRRCRPILWKRLEA